MPRHHAEQPDAQPDAPADAPADVIDTPAEVEAEMARAVPVSVRIAGAWSWRIVGVLVLAAVLVYLIVLLHIVVIPLLVATLLAGLLTPLKNRIVRAGAPRWLGVVVAFFTLLVVVAGLIVLVVITVRLQLTGPDLAKFQSKIVSEYQALLTFLKASPLGVTDADVANAIKDVTAAIDKNSSTIAAGALSGASTAGDILVGLVLSLFITLFFLIDGAGIWRWVVHVMPVRARAAVDGAGRAAWLSVGEYTRVQVLVAFIDAVGIGLVAGVGLRLPFAFPIGVLVFLAAFIPFVGAITTGFFAVLVALVYSGPVAALVMLAGVIGVNQLESHVLQPLLMGNAVRLHPVAVVLAVGTGSVLGGIAGAVFAVPLTAAGNSAIKYVAGGRWKGQPPPREGPIPEQPQDRPSPRRQRRPRPKDVTTVG